MALAIQSTTSNFNIFTNKKKNVSSSSSVHHLPIFFPIKTRFITVIRSTTQSSSSSSSTSSEDSKPANGEENKPNKTGVGFGSSSSTSSSSSSVETIDNNNNKKKKKKGAKSRERASITRRTPVEKPAFLSQKRAGGGGGGGGGGGTPQVEKQSETEKAFLLTWLGLGCVILIQGLTLSASGFLPEEWDKFLVKYLYPTFTPTVFFFVCGTVVYGVLKYMQGEEGKS